MDLAAVTLKVEKSLGKRRPVIHVLMPDGRTEEFRDRGIVLPEGEDRVYALLINGEGDPYRTPEGDLAIVYVPVFGLHPNADPAQLMDWRAVARHAGVSLATAKRMVDDGRLPKPSKIGKRKIGFKRAEVEAALARLK